MSCRHLHGCAPSQSLQKHLLLLTRLGVHMLSSHSWALSLHWYIYSTFPDCSVWDPVIQRWIRWSPFPWQAYGLLIGPVSCSYLLLIPSEEFIELKCSEMLLTTMNSLCHSLPVLIILCAVWLSWRNVGALAERQGVGASCMCLLCCKIDIWKLEMALPHDAMGEMPGPLHWDQIHKYLLHRARACHVCRHSRDPIFTKRTWSCS